MPENPKAFFKKATTTGARAPLTPTLSPPRGEGEEPLAIRTSRPISQAPLKTATPLSSFSPSGKPTFGRGEGLRMRGAPGSQTNTKGRVKTSYRTRTDKAKNTARHLRKKSTETEKRLWRLLRDRRFNEFKFRRQYQCGPYFLDFYCPDAHLAIELDGSGHGYPGQQSNDSLRDNLLNAEGIKVLRFWNNQLSGELESIRTTIWYELMERTGRTKDITNYLRIPKKS
ncbi:MAG TPA: DUF559 domain-containing protein [Verrucomicrobiae bacterium]